MGLSVGIAGSIVMITFLITFMMFPNTLLVLTTSLSGTVSDISDVENMISKTYINITSITAAGNTDDVDFTVSNNGLAKLWDYENFDVIITYNQKNPPSLSTEKLSYDGLCGAGALTRGTWCIDQFVNDILEPQILNTDESMQVKTRLNKIISNAAGARVIVIVTTDNGVTTTNAINP